jgi:hypothetical protein
MADAKKKSDARRIYTKYPGVCKSCGAEIKVGDLVTWYPGGTVYGTKCHKAPWGDKKSTAKQSAKQAPAQEKSSIPAEAIEKLTQMSALINSKNAHQQFLKVIGKKK